MSKLPSIKTWLTIDLTAAPNGRYEHALVTELDGTRSKMLHRLRVLVSEAHEDARRRLRRLAYGSLDPLGEYNKGDPADGYPEGLHPLTLKGYFGEILAGVLASNTPCFGNADWEVPTHLFRFHLVEFQHLALMKQTGQDPGIRPGRTGDDCLAFRLKDDRIVAALFCEAKCTKNHDTKLIRDAHEKSSLPNLVPVDLLQLVEVLEDSPDPAAAQWVRLLRRLFLEGAGAQYERIDQITHVCGQRPKREPCWIGNDKPHEAYAGGRRLHVAEVHLEDVER
jgi:hypothetical protein